MDSYVIVPAFNEESTVRAVVDQASALGRVVVVDDASDDSTGELAAAAGAVVVRHSRNTGYDGALASGFDRALELGADAVLTMDADGQHVPEVGRRFLDELASGADLVVGRRPARARWSETIFAVYSRARFGLADPLCGMKAFRSDVVRQHRSAMDRPTIGAGLTIAALGTERGWPKWTCRSSTGPVSPVSGAACRRT